jgi:hypothetical protein
LRRKFGYMLECKGAMQRAWLAPQSCVLPHSLACSLFENRRVLSGGVVGEEGLQQDA